jgi:hypothetical protein
MTATSLLALPYLAASQAQKHITHNEALRQLDALVQLSVKDRNLASPPSSPVETERHIVAASPSGAWSGKALQIAAFQDGAWAFYPPQTGWTAWVEAEGLLVVFTGTGWSDGIAGRQPVFERLGIGASPDATNLLALSSPASLFNHAGHGHQIKVNKAGTAETASLLYQSNWSGRAEMGLAGDDSFRLKVSADGSTWREAINANPATGAVSFPNTAGQMRAFASFGWVSSAILVRASLNVASITRNGAGDYTVNFASALTSSAYAVMLSSTAMNVRLADDVSARSASAFRLRCMDSGFANADAAFVDVAVFS